MPDGHIGPGGGDTLAAAIPLLREIVFLKRIRSAGREGSAATRLFFRAWAALTDGAGGEEDAVRPCCERIVAAALASVRLGDLDAAALADLGVDPAPVLADAAGEFAACLPPEFRHAMLARLNEAATTHGQPPEFARALAGQPRAGITCPGLPRIALPFTENHAEHCLSVAVGGAVLAARFGADPSSVFLAGLAHHLHNAAMPDSGYAGEMLLGPHLTPVMHGARERALAQLPASLADRCRLLLDVIATDDTPVARAFHAADVLDRVLEVEVNLDPARLTMHDVLDRYALVHAGPVKAFHDRVLADAGLACG